jgi:hypothetical protein
MKGSTKILRRNDVGKKEKKMKPFEKSDPLSYGATTPCSSMVGLALASTTLLWGAYLFLAAHSIYRHNLLLILFIVIMSSQDAPNFEFADSSPTRPGRKHRRGRGQASRKTTMTTGGGGGSSQTTSTPMLSESHNYLHNHPYTKQNYYASDSWDNAAIVSTRNNHHTTNNSKDDNSCSGSLTYSASSSVQSAESSNDSSFADIIKLLDSTEGGGGDGGVTDVHKFIANNSMKAVCNDNQKKKNKIKRLFSMSGGYKSNMASNEELDYSSNDSEDEQTKTSDADVDNKILETIAG